MYLAIMFFLAKMLDLVSTNIALSKGRAETNLIYNNFGEFGMFIVIYLFTFIIYFSLLIFKQNKILKEVLLIYIFISFIVPLYNIISIYLR